MFLTCFQLFQIYKQNQLQQSCLFIMMMIIFSSNAYDDETLPSGRSSYPPTHAMYAGTRGQNARGWIREMHIINMLQYIKYYSLTGYVCCRVQPSGHLPPRPRVSGSSGGFKTFRRWLQKQLMCLWWRMHILGYCLVLKPPDKYARRKHRVGWRRAAKRRYADKARRGTRPCLFPILNM